MRDLVIEGTTVRGSGWTLELTAGWVVRRSVRRSGDFEAVLEQRD